jgi:hypothetical protein
MEGAMRAWRDETGRQCPSISLGEITVRKHRRTAARLQDALRPISSTPVRLAQADSATRFCAARGVIYFIARDGRNAVMGRSRMALYSSIIAKGGICCDQGSVHKAQFITSCSSHTPRALSMDSTLRVG